jgi:predicted DNA-binding WGR domain protein
MLDKTTKRKEFIMNVNKWALLKVSDGNRGINGKKKIYEILVEGNKVTFSWGMAEKSSRQTSVIIAANENAAMFTAKQKLWDKVATGYEVAYRV